MKKRRFLSAFGIAMLGVLVIQTRSDAAILQASSLWEKRILRVCFAETRADIKNSPVSLGLDSKGENEVVAHLRIVPLNGELKRMIEVAVTASFSAERTGVSFAGFKSCCEDPGAEVPVFYVQDETDPELITERFLGAGDTGKPAGFSRNAIRINDSKLRGYLNETVSVTMTDLIRWKYGRQNAFEKNWENFGRYELVKGRADDTLAGGDIDLLLRVQDPEQDPEQDLALNQKIHILLNAIKKRIGDQHIDLSIKTREKIATDPFWALALKKSVILNKWYIPFRDLHLSNLWSVPDSKLNQKNTLSVRYY